MGTVFKKTATKPLPENAKIIIRKGERFAEWVNTKGKKRTAPVTVGRDESDRIRVTARTYTAKFRDGSGIVQEVATGCRDEAAARSILTKLERRAELVKGEVLSVAENAIADHQSTPLSGHVADYISHQTVKGLNQVRIKNTQNRLQRLAEECGFRRLADLNATGLNSWLAARQAEGMGAGTRNEYRQEMVGFGNWCVRNHRLLNNPFSEVPKADAKADCRRKRRALTEEELARLLDAARRRPLLEAMTIRTGKNKGKPLGKLREESRIRLERLGRERVLIYKTLVLTGLRKNELASITVGQVMLDVSLPYLILNAADEKNREGSTIPLRSDLAADLREWITEKTQEACENVKTIPFDPEYQKGLNLNTDDSMGQKGQACQELTTIPALPNDTPLFTVPRDLVKILDRDLVAAGLARRVEVSPGKWKIDKQDERGRTIDVHALRHTFGTLLSKAGVAPRTAQAAMRHSTIDLTMNTYTDPKLLDVAGAVEALPELPLVVGEPHETNNEIIDVKATGTDNSAFCRFAPKFAPTSGNSSKLESIVGNAAGKTHQENSTEAIDVSSYPGKEKDPLTTSVNRPSLVERKRFELSTSALRTQRSPS
jgi:integrase